MRSHMLNEADETPAGIVTSWYRVSVLVVPRPLSHAYHVPVLVGLEVLLVMTPAVATHGVGFADPFSNPPLTTRAGAALTTVKLVVLVAVPVGVVTVTAPVVA